MLHVTVMGPNEFGCSCMVASLAAVAGVEARACKAVSEAHAVPPDVILLQDLENAVGASWLAEHVSTAVRRWPGAELIVLSSEGEAGLRACLAAGVRGYLSPHSDLDLIVSVLHLVHSGLAVYPGRLLSALQLLNRLSFNGALSGQVPTPT